MKNGIVFLLLFASNICKASPAMLSALCFIEQKGQIKDQAGKPRPDIDVSLRSPGMAAFIGQGQIHYQFYNIQDEETGMASVYRMDVELVGANRNARAIKLDIQPYVERYYLPGLGDQGAIAQAYNKVLYKDIYPGIDWLLYIKHNRLEHEFIVHDGADPGQIRIKYSGATGLKINGNGSITAHTPMGSITEATPYCYTDDNSIVRSAYKLEDNILSFDIAAYTGTLTIDPAVVWATYYYGTSNNLRPEGLACAGSQDIYMCGRLNYACEGIATVGAFQDTLSGDFNAFLVKFDSTGNRVWATYYGGDQGLEDAYGVACDSAGNIYMCGNTGSQGSLATPGAHQQTYEGNYDAFLVKFSPAGQRIWATYYGGTERDYGRSVATNGSHVLLCGSTQSANGIASPTGHQQNYAGNDDAFLVMFDSSGSRIWGTYYGGSGHEYNQPDAAFDKAGNACLAGVTSSAGNISSPGSYQETIQTTADGYLAKFTPGGVRLWGTYYGGLAGAAVRTVATDYDNNVYITGHAGDNMPYSDIATPGCYQPEPGGSTDIFIAKLNPQGQRVWGTYLGGEGIDANSKRGMHIDRWNNIYIAASVDSLGIPGLSSPFQPTVSGYLNGFAAKLDSAGSLKWAGYLGSAGVDRLYHCTSDGQGNVFFSGLSTYDSLGTPGTFQPYGMIGGENPLLIKIFDTLPPLSVNKILATKTINIYPNPSSGSITIESPASAEGELFTIDGRRVMRMNIRKGRTYIHMPENSAEGVYFIRCHLKTGELLTEKIIYKE